MKAPNAYLERLRSFPPVAAATLEHAQGQDTLVVKTTRRAYRLVVAHSGRTLSPIVAARIIFEHGAPPRRIVMAPLIAGGVAHRFAAAGLNYVDLAGNCHLVLGREVYVHVEGQRAPRAAPSERGIRAAGYQTLFAYLASARLDLPVRAVAELAGVSRQAALELRDRLLAEGYVIESTLGLRWDARRREEALRRWLEGYRSTVRPRLLHGTFRTRGRGRPDEVEAIVASAAGPPGTGWRWGGSAAAYALRRYYRSEKTVIHVRDDVDGFTRALPALRAADGNLVIMRSFGDVNWQPDHGGQTVHPLLVYSELLIDDDDRAREAAADLFDNEIRTEWAP